MLLVHLTISQLVDEIWELSTQFSILNIKTIITTVIFMGLQPAEKMGPTPAGLCFE